MDKVTEPKDVIPSSESENGKRKKSEKVSIYAVSSVC